MLLVPTFAVRSNKPFLGRNKAMPLELKYLLYSTILCFVQVLVATAAAQQAVGLPVLAGNRESLGELPGFAGRARRAHMNMIENMVLFASLVLIATTAGRANAASAIGAMIFFWARLAYAVIYLVGIPWLRTFAWFVSVIGMIVVALQLLLRRLRVQEGRWNLSGIGSGIV